MNTQKGEPPKHMGMTERWLKTSFFAMDRLPTETLAQVFSLLQLSTLCACRLVHRRFATVAFRFVTRRIAVLNTAACVERLIATLGRSIPSQEMTVYHVPWEVLPEQRSGVHQLLRLRGGLEYPGTGDERFIPKEAVWDTTAVQKLLEALPRLQAINFNYPLGPKVVTAAHGGSSLPMMWDGGWLPSPFMTTPYWCDAFTETVSLVLSQLNGFPSITTVGINGKFSAGIIPDIHHVCDLSIESLSRTSPNDEETIRSFLLAFRNIQHLRLNLGGSSQLISCEGLTWPYLNRLELCGFQMASSSLITLIRRNEKLTHLECAYTMLDGRWNDFFLSVSSGGGKWNCMVQIGRCILGTLILPNPADGRGRLRITVT